MQRDGAEPQEAQGPRPAASKGGRVWPNGPADCRLRLAIRRLATSRSAASRGSSQIATTHGCSPSGASPPDTRKLPELAAVIFRCASGKCNRRPGHNWHLPPLLPSRNWSHLLSFLASARIKVLNCCPLVTPICTILLLCSDLINGANSDDSSRPT